MPEPLHQHVHVESDGNGNHLPMMVTPLVVVGGAPAKSMATASVPSVTPLAGLPPTFTSHAIGDRLVWGGMPVKLVQNHHVRRKKVTGQPRPAWYDKGQDPNATKYDKYATNYADYPVMGENVHFTLTRGTDPGTRLDHTARAMECVEVGESHGYVQMHQATGSILTCIYAMRFGHFWGQRNPLAICNHVI